jgi:hypothetical protein
MKGLEKSKSNVEAVDAKYRKLQVELERRAELLAQERAAH